MFSVSPSAYISTSNEVPIDVHGLFQIYCDGRFERLAGLNTIAAGTDQLTKVQSKDVVISQQTNLSARIYIPKSTTRNNLAMDPWISKFGCSRILMCVAEKDKCLFRALNYKKVMEKSGWNGRFEMFESKGERHVFFLFNTSSENACALRKRIGAFINPILSKA